MAPRSHAKDQPQQESEQCLVQVTLIVITLLNDKNFQNISKKMIVVHEKQKNFLHP